MTVFSENEIERLLEALQGTYLYMSTYLSVVTGMRAGEILGLAWADVDLEQCAVTVKQALQRFKKGDEPVFSEPKTAGSRRRVELFAEAVAELKKYNTAWKEKKCGAGEAWKNYDLICYDDSSPINPATFARLFRDKTEKLKMAWRVHDLTHLHATFLLKIGIHPKIVA
ncbi:MAG: site-specific integrase [Dethiobacter sp.]|jgi:integrase|nr:site-specific integrase [Dethiobacter sp.]